jgi:hypothetical protein
VLTVNVPRAVKAQPKRTPVTAGQASAANVIEAEKPATS